MAEDQSSPKQFTASGQKKPEQPNALKKMFWYFAPAQSAVIVQATDDQMSAEYYPSMDISPVGHVLFALLWIGAVGAYSIFVTYQHFTKPDMESFLHEPAEHYGPVKVNVSAWCTKPEVGCGTITISQQFGPSAPSQCQGLKDVFVQFADTERRSAEVELCFTGEHIYSTNNDDPLPASLGLLIDFRKIMPAGYTPPPVNATPAPYAPYNQPNPDPYGGGYGYPGYGGYPGYPPAARRRFRELDHHSLSPSATGAVLLTKNDQPNFAKLINLESWQVKTVVMGQYRVEKYGEFQPPEIYPIAVQYEGRRPSMRGTVVVSLASYADVGRVMKRAADFTIIGVMGLLGTCCGMAFMVNSLSPWLTKFFVKVFPGPAEKAKRAKWEEEQKAKKARLASQEACATDQPPTSVVSGGATGETLRDPLISANSGTSSSSEEHLANAPVLSLQAGGGAEQEIEMAQAASTSSPIQKGDVEAL